MVGLMRAARRFDGFLRGRGCAARVSPFGLAEPDQGAEVVLPAVSERSTAGAFAFRGASGSASPTTDRTTAHVTLPGAGPSPHQEVDHSLADSHSRRVRGPDTDPDRAGDDASRVRAAAGRPAGLDRLRMEGARRDRDARVGLEPLRVVSAPTRLRLCGLEQLRDPAGEPVPAGVAWPAGFDVAGAGGLADPVHPQSRVRVAVGGVGVLAGARLVLSAVAW